jgi:hypothetical protein
MPAAAGRDSGPRGSRGKHAAQLPGRVGDELGYRVDGQPDRGRGHGRVGQARGLEQRDHARELTARGRRAERAGEPTEQHPRLRRDPGARVAAVAEHQPVRDQAERVHLVERDPGAYRRRPGRHGRPRSGGRQIRADPQLCSAQRRGAAHVRRRGHALRPAG